MKRILLAALLGLVMLAGCKSKNGAPKAPDVKVSEKLELKIERTDRDLAALDINNLAGAGAALKSRYGSFIDLYSDGILGIGTTSSPEYAQGLYAFLTYPMVQEALSSVNQTFTPEVVESLEEQLSEAFSRYKGTFPSRDVPKVYGFVAGFNQSVMVADSILGIGLDKYLGAGYKNYQSMGVPMYLIRKMDKSMIVPDAMYAWIGSEFPIRRESEPLLSHMVYQGKLLFAVAQMLPNISDSTLFGFTSAQTKWVKKNEKMMWEILVAQKLLFDSELFVRTKMVGEAPFTSIYTKESPGKAASWQGYRIVSAYMRNSGSTLNDLMQENDYQKILDVAKYRP